MKKTTLPLALLALALPLQAQVRMDYEKVSQANGEFTSRFVLHNQTGQPLDGDWTIYFTQLPVYPHGVSTPQLDIQPILANYFKLSPTAAWKPLADGDSLVFSATFGGDLSRESYVPEGMFWVGKDGKPVAVDFHARPFADQELTRGVEKNYLLNAHLQTSGSLSPTDVLPSVKESTLQAGVCDLNRGFRVVPDGLTGSESELLAEALTTQAGLQSLPAGVPIQLRVDGSLASASDEYYTLRVRPEAITITGKTTHGVWNGTRTLLALLRNPLNAKGLLQNMDINDWPDFAYRGQMIDIARNYMPYQRLLKVIDQLANYKLSVLHFHFCDDEGWRLEIPGLPELTEIGSRRGYTLDESTCLYPAYDGHYDPNGPTTGNGFITRQQFIDLLRYAKARHVAVVPEVECPGHARAAVRAMEARYAKYMRLNDPVKAEEYRLVDPNDTSRYTSAQGYHDNAMDPGLPSALRFMLKVIDEVDDMYREAGVTMPFLHLGGDEVADEVWSGSPATAQLSAREGIKGKEEVSSWFYQKIIEHLASRGLKFGGWQEIVTRHKPLDTPLVKQSAGGINLWSAVPEWGTGDYYHQMANNGWPVIMSDVTNCYLDLAYSRHPEEPGLQWGGTVDEAVTFALLPYDFYRSMHDSINGQPRQWTTTPSGLLPLRPEARKNIIGVQGQLWAETIRGPQWVEYQLFPKIMGLLERGWNATPSWESLQGEAAEAAYYRDLATYYQKISLCEMPAWAAQQVNFRLPNPGLQLLDGQVFANSPIVGSIRYTTDGTTPTATSPLYTGPVPFSGTVFKARLFRDGKESVTSTLINEAGK